MDRETALKKASEFKDDWEIDPQRKKGFHKPTGFEIYMGSIWRNAEGMHYDAVIGYRAGNYPDRKETKEEINELQRQFGILYEAGYMPGRTREEKEEESRRIDEAVARSRAWHDAQVAKEKAWRQNHPEEYKREVEQNIHNYFAQKQQAAEKWYQDRGKEMPEENKKYYEQETKKMIEKFHREQATKNNTDR